MKHLGSLVSAAALLSTIACKGGDAPPEGKPVDPNAERADLACADVTLVPGAAPRPGYFGFASNARPSVAVSFARTRGFDGTRALVRDCDPNGATTELTFTEKKDGFFIRHQGEASDALDRACVDVFLYTYGSGGRVLDSTSARILRGDFTVEGRIEARIASGTEGVAGARVQAALERFSVSTNSNNDGTFTLHHLPQGMIWKLSAQAASSEAEPMSAEHTLRRLLDVTTPSVAVNLTLSPTPQMRDPHEPDDSVGEAAVRPPLAFGAGESHVAAEGADLDFVPFVATFGRRYQLRVRSTSEVIGDFRLAFVDGTGNVLAERGCSMRRDFSLGGQRG